MLVKGEGDVKSKIWIIGESPGAQEEAIGKPFIGGAGMILDGLLRKSSIQRGGCYIDNIIQERPPKNDFGIYYSDKGRKSPTQDLLNAYARIRNLAKEHKPNIIILCGNEPLAAFFNHKGILNWRGSILNFQGIKCIPVIHPAAIMREPKLKPIAEMDWNRIAVESKSPSLPLPYNDNFIIVPSYEQCIKMIRELHKHSILSFDIETVPDMEQIMCIGFGWSQQDALCIPIFYSQSSWWSIEEELGIIKELKYLFSNPNIKFIAQNAQYDMTYIADQWGIKCNLWMDTMIAFHCVYPEMRKSLAFLTSIYSKRPYYKEDGWKDPNPTKMWKYNCTDCAVTFEVAMHIREEMKEFETLKFYEEHSHKLIEPLMQMQRRGILINTKRRKEVDNELQIKLEELQNRLNKAIGKEVNVNSPKQIKELLYEDFGLPHIYGWGTKEGQKAKVLSTDEDAINQLQKITNNPVLGIILEIRGIVKLLGTYVRATLESDSRMCTSYKITGTETGRLSSSKSIYNRGTNIQNIPRAPIIRSMFIADPGMVLVNADLSQAEARIVAYQAREERMISVFQRGEDIHKFNAAIIYNCNPSQVTPTQRQAAKNRVHGANYRIGALKASKLAGTTEEKAREDLNKYKSYFPMLEIWWKEVEAQIGSTRIMTNYFGRKRMFFDRWGHELVNEAIAYYPQSTVGDLLNYGIINSYKNLPQDWEYLVQNHDSILAQVPEDTDPVHIHKFFKHYFEIPLEIHGRQCVIPIDIKIGLNWGELKELKLS